MILWYVNQSNDHLVHNPENCVTFWNFGTWHMRTELIFEFLINKCNPVKRLKKMW